MKIIFDDPIAQCFFDELVENEKCRKNLIKAKNNNFKDYSGLADTVNFKLKGTENV